MPKDQKKPSLPRQPPVSCRFCRARKLRCDRKSPCSSCVSRKILCELEQTSNDASPAVTPDSAVLARLQRLEELLTAEPRQHSFQTMELALNKDTTARHIATTPMTPKLKGLDQDVAWLESMYQHRIPFGKEQSGQFVFQTICINNLEQILSFDQPTYSNIIGRAQPKQVLVPLQHETKILLDKYVDDVDFIHHVVHIPSLKAAVEDVYASLSKSEPAKTGHVILLLSVISSSTYSWTDMDDRRNLFRHPADAHKQSSFWIKAGQELLDTVHRSITPTIEAVQGAVILAFVAAHHEEGSTSFNAILSLALQMARSLGLHRLDHPSMAGKLGTVYSEVGRRVWWYLVSSDRFLACKFGGTVEGTYQCHPRQMITRKPLNLDDQDLDDSLVPKEKPWSTPTTMSYFIQRLKLAELCRRYVDSDPLAMSAASPDVYESVLDFDTGLQDVLNDLPAFFSMTSSDIIKHFQLDQAQAYRIASQGYIIHHMSMSFRCKLHVPYMMRGYTDQRYATSRQICTKTARTIIQNEMKHKSTGLLHVNRYQFSGFVLGIFVASVVLLVELCVDKTTSRQSYYRQEVIDAFRMLEVARGRSRTAARFLDSLLSVLRKHQVAPPRSLDPKRSRSTVVGGQSPIVPEAATTRGDIDQPIPTPESSAISSDVAIQNINSPDASIEDTFEDGMDMSSYFDMLNYSLQQGSDMEFCDWDGLFSGLGSMI